MIENINWYPGHMKKTRELIQENLKLVDLVIEVIDARIPVSSRNPIIDDLVKSKQRIIILNKSDLSDNFKFVKENMTCKILSYKGKVFGVEPPTFVTLEVTETEPGLKGNTATNTLKPAKVETGAEIRVPLFINEGDMIRIDTRTCEYMERA